MDLQRFTRFDWYSMAAVPIQMHFRDQPLAIGTAFFWEQNDDLYLVTAWHNFSGRNFETKEHISKTAAEPDRIKVWWNLDAQPVGLKGASFIQIRDASDKPLWLVDTEKGCDIDVAVLPVTRPPNAEPYPINKLPEDFLGMAVGHDVFVLGFPLGLEGALLPIWKRGTLASEWQIREEAQPYWLIDTASRSGMSGAPVIQRSYDYNVEAAKCMDYGNNGKTRFLGLYSGRYTGSEKEDLQLGIDWSFLYMDRIIRGQRTDGQAPVQWPPVSD